MIYALFCLLREWLYYGEPIRKENSMGMDRDHWLVNMVGGVVDVCLLSGSLWYLLITV